MTASTVSISVITATYNSVATLADALDSLESQTHKNREHIVIDGESTDGTLALLESRRERISILVSERDNGIYDALNKGLQRATGDVIGVLHSDDVLANPSVLSTVAEAFKDPSVDVVYGDLQYVRRTDAMKVVRHWRAGAFKREALRRGWMPPHPALFVRRDVYSRIGGFDGRFTIAADYHSILRIFSQPGLNATYVPAVFVRMRLGGISNRSLRSIFRKSAEDWDALRSTRTGGVLALLLKNTCKLRQFFV